MRNHVKKLLSFLLVICLLASSFALSLTALAQGGISLELNGGTLTGTTQFSAGDTLPNYEKITKAGVTFGGWYTDAAFTSTQAFVAADNTTYYARWITKSEELESFDSYASDTDFKGKWADWTCPDTTSSYSLNTDANHSYSGNGSLSLSSSTSATWTQIIKDMDISVVGTGVALWIESTAGAKVAIQFNQSGQRRSQFRQVPAGKFLITIPWTEINGIYDLKAVWSLGIAAGVTQAGSVAYIDSIGTFTDYTGGSVTFNTNGGTWAQGYTAPTTYTTGMALPSMDNVKNGNMVFAGWYDNVGLTGNPVYVVPASATGELTYYARWVSVDVNYADFENHTDDSVVTIIKTTDDTGADKSNGFITEEEGKGGFYFWSGVVGTTVQLNKNSALANSGSNSAKLVLKVKDSTTLYNSTQFGSDRVFFPTDKDLGEGIAFWINTDKQVEFDIQFNWRNACGKITVPAGKHYVTIPWTEFNNNKAPWIMLFRFTNPSEETTIYIDDIGTYSSVVDGTVSFNLNGGAWAPGYTAPDGYTASSGLVLPNLDNVRNNGLAFAGWYDNENLTGSPVTAIAPGASGNKQFYAKWVVHDVNFDNFENFDNDADLKSINHWSPWTWPAASSVTSLNTEAAHAYNGSKSLKVKLNEANKDETLDLGRRGFSKTGDGIAFWVESTHGAKIYLKLSESASYKTAPVTVPAGKQLVTIPWSSFASAFTGTEFWSTTFYVQVPNADGVVYLDEIGTYEEDTASAKTITYDTLGGSWKEGYSAPTKYTAKGVKLPAFGILTREGFIFAGWYDNADFSGAPVYTTTSGDVTLYAKWIVHTSNCDNFDSYTDSTGQWAAWNSSATVALNTSSDNSYSGANSLKVVAAHYGAHKEKNAAAGGWVNYPISGNGVSLWVKAEIATEITVYVGKGTTGGAQATVAVPAGRTFVSIPWTSFTGTLPSGESWVTRVSVATSYGNGVTNTVYVDDLGTYIGSVKYQINYELGADTQWADSYNAPTEYTDSGCSLPTYENVKNKTNDKLTFIGWCEKADLSDAPVGAIPVGATGNKTYYPKWAVIVPGYETFENYADTNDLTEEKTTSYWSSWNTDAAVPSLNTDTAHVHKGNKSMKITLNNTGKSGVSSIVNNKKSIAKMGDGICFWIETEQETKFRFRFNYISSTSPGAVTEYVAVPKGKSFVAIPWSAVPESVRESIWGVNLQIGLPENVSSTTVYVDNIGTYSNGSDLAITYHLNDGSFISGSSPAMEYDPFGDTALPTDRQVAKEGFAFAGWFTNPEFTGMPVFVITPSSSEKKEYWAKWVEQVNINHDFENFANTGDMEKAQWRDQIGWEDWNSQGGGFKLYLEDNTANLALGSTKGLRGEYTVPNNEYVQQGYGAPYAAFYNYSWSTTFGKRGTSREGDGFTFWIKSDHTTTMKMTFLNNGDPKQGFSSSTFTIPANEGVRVYLPWSCISDDCKVLASTGFGILNESIGTKGTIWLDDLGIYYNEKIVDFVASSDDGDMKVTGYNNHIPKGTRVKFVKQTENDLAALGGALPKDSKLAYFANYSLLNENGGMATLYGGAWVSFKLPVGADTTKIGVYDVFFDGSLAPVNYTFEGNWITVYTLNPDGNYLITLNDEHWNPKGIAIEGDQVQNFTETVTTIVKTEIDNPDKQDNTNTNTDTDTDKNNNGTTGNKRPPKREPIKDAVDNNEAQSSFPWVIIAIGAGAAVLVAAGIIVIIVVASKRRRSK